MGNKRFGRSKSGSALVVTDDFGWGEQGCCDTDLYDFIHYPSAWPEGHLFDEVSRVIGRAGAKLSFPTVFRMCRTHCREPVRTVLGIAMRNPPHGRQHQNAVLTRP